MAERPAQATSFDGLSERARRHFMTPSHVGSLAAPTAVGRRENPVCGDAMILQIQVESGIVTEARFKTFGCSTSIAASSALTTLLRGLSVDGARKLDRAALEAELGGLTQYQQHSLDLVLETLGDALAKLRP